MKTKVLVQWIRTPKKNPSFRAVCISFTLKFCEFRNLILVLAKQNRWKERSQSARNQPLLELPVTSLRQSPRSLMLLRCKC